MMVSLDDHRRIHFVGIAGAGMSGLARYLAGRGFEISGSDRDPGAGSVELGALGIRVCTGHQAEHVHGSDLVVISSAIREDNPELVEARARDITVIKRAELLGAIANPAYGIAVAGTHGKSTTSGMIAHVLTEAQLDPTVLIGAVSRSLGSNARTGESDLVVVEADEYDRSFLQLQPRIGVILNAEAEHLDTYGTEAAVMEAFSAFAASASDLLVSCADDSGARQATRAASAPVVTYGIDQGEWRADAIQETATCTTFVVRHAGATTDVTLRLPGRHNVRNALAVFAVCAHLGISADRVAHCLASFAGVQRRLELRGDVAGAPVIDDYAHHPTEMEASLHAIRQRYPEARVLLAFQPHTYSRTQAFFRGMADALCAADRVYLMDIYAARETDTLGVHSRGLAEAAERIGACVRYTGDRDQTVAAIRRDVKAGDVVVTMGAGDVNRVADALLDDQGVAA